MEKFTAKLLTSCGQQRLRTSFRCFWGSKKDEEDKTSPREIVCKKPDVVYDHSPDLDDYGIYGVDPCDPEKKFEAPRVVIIGAGMAGLSAAARLSEHKINNYVVLEALERPGGRIHSCWLGDAPVELGAPWRVDQTYTNPLFKILAAEDPHKPGAPVAFNTRNFFDRVTCGHMHYPNTVRAYYKFKQIEQEADTIFCYGGSKQHGSLINFMSLRIQQELHTFPEEQQHDAARVMFGLLQMMISRSNNDTAYVSCGYDGWFIHYPGAEVRVPLGLSGIFAPLMRKIEGTVRYCKPVHCVYWGTCMKYGYRAVVSCADGDEYPADYVIVTTSLGVLQRNHDKLFCPGLSGNKVNAIRNLCCGHCNRIYLQYDNPFWAWQTYNLNLKFSSELSCVNGWAKYISATEIAHESKYVLGVWVTGHGAIEMEKVCDRDIAEGVTSALRLITGKKVPYPYKVLRSGWSTAPYFSCAYSHDAQQSDGCLQRELAKPLPEPEYPVPPILLFAGEATVPGLYATVAGAKISGIREAERVMQLTRQFRGPPLPVAQTTKQAFCN